MPDQIKSDVRGVVNTNGIDIFYEYFGKKDRPAIVIFNGVAMEASSWHNLIQVLLPEVDVLLWDYRGQGKSTSDDVPYCVEELPDCLMAIIDELKLENKNVNLLGVSTGSIVVAETLRRYGDRINRAVMSGILLEKAMAFKYDSDFGIRLLREDHVDLWADALYTKIMSDGFLLQIEQSIPAMKEALYNRYKNRPYALARIIEAQSNYLWDIEKYYPDYKNVKTPIMVFSGAEDRITPPFYQKRVCELFPDATYKEYSGCAHIPFIEKTAEAFGDAVAFFLEK